MNNQTDFTYGVAMSYKGVVHLLTNIAKGVKVYLTATPDDYFTANGDNTWTSAKTGEVVTPDTLGHIFADIPEDRWVYETPNGIRH